VRGVVHGGAADGEGPAPRSIDRCLQQGCRQLLGCAGIYYYVCVYRSMQGDY
jgi:hypothetical protein